MFFKITIKILIMFFIVIAGGFGVWFFFNAQKAEDVTEKNKSSPAIFKEEKGEKTEFVGGESPASAQTQKYENAKYGFSFDYPNDFKISEFEEEDGKSVLTAQNGKTGRGLQIYITAYDDPSFAVSKERVLKDVPDMPFSNSADIVVRDKAKGVAFFSQNEAFGGATAEVWFADGKNFYQATAKAEDAKTLEEIIKSWKF